MRMNGRLARLLVVIALLALPQFAAAAKPLVVGAGTSASCTEAALKQALAVAAGSGGGTIRFNCGRGLVTIILAAPVIVPHNTTIDGDGMITLSRTGPTFEEDFILVDRDSTVVLKNLTVSHDGTIAGGFALFNEGTLTIKDSTFSQNFLTVLNEGTLTVLGSTFSDNGSLFGPAGAIWNQGTLKVKNSLFSNNESGGGGAGIFNSGTLTVENSTFADNLQEFFGTGGGILNLGTASVEKSVFSRNGAGAGGGIGNSGTLSVKDTVFDGNDGNLLGGGAIFNSGSARVSNSVFSNGFASDAGGGIFNAGKATISTSEFFGNFVARLVGGGVFNLGVLSVSNSSITGNTAAVDGGGIYTCVTGDFFFFHCAGTLDLTKTVVTGNTPNDIVP